MVVGIDTGEHMPNVAAMPIRQYHFLVVAIIYFRNEARQFRENFIRSFIGYTAILRMLRFVFIPTHFFCIIRWFVKYIYIVWALNFCCASYQLIIPPPFVVKYFA